MKSLLPPCCLTRDCAVSRRKSAPANRGQREAVVLSLWGHPGSGCTLSVFGCRPVGFKHSAFLSSRDDCGNCACSPETFLIQEVHEFRQVIHGTSCFFPTVVSVLFSPITLFCSRLKFLAMSLFVITANRCKFGFVIKDIHFVTMRGLTCIT